MLLIQGSLLASLILSKLLQNKKYSVKKYISVLMITIGIIICTLATAKTQVIFALFSHFNFP